MPENLTPNRVFLYRPHIPINYEVAGHGATPVVFLHGFAAALTTWHDIRPLFPPERFRLYLLDLKGFGFSSKPRDGRYAPEDQADMVTAFMEHEGLSGVVLVGHSLGGGIALLVHLRDLATGRGRLVSRLVLIASAAYPQRLPRFMRWFRLPLVGQCILHLLPLRFIVRYTLEHVIHNREAITPERIERYRGCFGGAGMSRVFVATCRQLDPDQYGELAASYRTIAIPTLIIWGEHDPIVRTYLGERLHDDIPGSRLVVLAACGHIPHEERPAETYAAMREFLDRLPSPS